MSGTVLRPMTVGDIDAALAIERLSSPHPWTRGIFDDELRGDPSRAYTVAESDGTVIAFCGLLLQADEAHVVNVAVHPDQRRARVATLLLADALDQVRCRGIDAVTLEVRASNRAAQRLYHRFGFAPVGVRPKYYERTEDAVIMWVHGVCSDEYAARLAALARTGEVAR